MSEHLSEIADDLLVKKRDIRIVGAISHHGSYKRVFQVEREQDSERRTILKLFRTVLSGTHYSVDSKKIRAEIEKEIRDIRELQVLMPHHTPGYVGKYEGFQQGYLVDEVIGSPMEDKMGKTIKVPSIEQYEEFRSAVEELMAKGVYLEFDALRPHNLLIGHLDGEKVDRIWLAEPLINRQENRVGAEFYCKRGLDLIKEKYFSTKKA